MSESRGLFPSKDEPTPIRYAPALIPSLTDHDYDGVRPLSDSVVLEWFPGRADGPPGVNRTGHYEVMLTASTLDAAVTTAAALNERA